MINSINSICNLFKLLNLEIELSNLSQIPLVKNFLIPDYNKYENKIDVFIFDVELKRDISIKSKEIKYLKIKAGNNNKILQLNINNILKNKKLGNLFLFSNYKQKYSNDHRLVNIICKIKEESLMHERVLFMYSFINSKLFNNPVCFIDTDAFIKIDFLDIFNNDFDIALTHTEDIGLMPINEGVFFVNNINKFKVKNFFKDYVIKYEIIKKSKIVFDYYKINTSLWRGGQLSINMLAYNNGSIFRDYEIIDKEKYKIMFLPTFYYNFSPSMDRDYKLSYLKNKKVFHFKGYRKRNLDYVDKIIN